MELGSPTPPRARRRRRRRIRRIRRHRHRRTPWRARGDCSPKAASRGCTSRVVVAVVVVVVARGCMARVLARSASVIFLSRRVVVSAVRKAASGGRRPPGLLALGQHANNEAPPAPPCPTPSPRAKVPRLWLHDPSSRPGRGRAANHVCPPLTRAHARALRTRDGTTSANATAATPLYFSVERHTGGRTWHTHPMTTDSIVGADIGTTWCIPVYAMHFAKRAEFDTSFHADGWMWALSSDSEIARWGACR